MIEDKDHDKMVEYNEWLTNLDEVFAFIKEASNPKNSNWHWLRNSDCKYVNLCIDMRDGGFTLKDRDNKRISLKQLKWQYGKI